MKKVEVKVTRYTPRSVNVIIEMEDDIFESLQSGDITITNIIEEGNCKCNDKPAFDQINLAFDDLKMKKTDWNIVDSEKYDILD